MPKLTQPVGPVRMLVAAPDGAVFAVSDQGLHVHPADGAPPRLIDAAAAVAAAVHPAGGLVVGYLGEDHSTVGVARLDAAGGRQVLDTEFEEEGLSCLDATAGAIAVGGDFTVELRDGDGAVEVRLGCDKWPYVVRFSPGRDRLFVGSWSGAGHVLDVARLRAAAGDSDDVVAMHRLDGKTAVALPYAGGPIMDAAFLGDGRVVVAAARGGVAIWDPMRPRRLVTVDNAAGANAVVVLPGGTAFAVGDSDGVVQVFAVPAAGKPIARPLRSLRLPGTGEGRWEVKTFYRAPRAQTIHCMAVVGDALVLGLDSGAVHRIALADLGGSAAAR